MLLNMFMFKYLKLIDDVLIYLRLKYVIKNDFEFRKQSVIGFDVVVIRFIRYIHHIRLLKSSKLDFTWV